MQEGAVHEHAATDRVRLCSGAGTKRPEAAAIPGAGDPSTECRPVHRPPKWRSTSTARPHLLRLPPLRA